MDIQARFADFNQKHQVTQVSIELQTEDRWIVHISGELDLQSSSDAQSILGACQTCRFFETKGTP